jgi:hypothetical protein
MIKFFRKIRQQLLTENKFSRYLIYAIGEIVLVVIGILIALQINNQNENRKNRKLASIYKSALINDLILDIEHFNYHSSLAYQENKRIDSIRTILNTPTSTFETLNKVIKNGLSFIRKEPYIMLATSEYPTLTNNTFLSLQNSGEITILDNKLQEELARFYGYNKKYSFMIKEIIASKNKVYFDYINSIPYKQSELNVVNSKLYEQIWDKVNLDKVQIKFITLLNTYYELNLKDEFFNSIRQEKTNVMIDLLKTDLELGNK